MGQRGPQPTPTNVHLLRGNPGKRAIGSLVDPINPPVEIPGCPKHLQDEARREWRRAGVLLRDLGLISKIDRASFALYCEAWADWVWCKAELARAKEAASAGALAAKARGEEWKGGDGFMLPTPNGSFTYSPYWVGANKAAEQLHKFQALFGMAPSSRGRVTPSNHQMSLPGMPDPKSGFNAM